MDIVSVHSDTCRYVHCMLKMTRPAQFVPAAAARIPIYCRVLFDVFFFSFHLSVGFIPHAPMLQRLPTG